MEKLIQQKKKKPQTDWDWAKKLIKYGSEVTHMLQTLAGLLEENLNSSC